MLWKFAIFIISVPDPTYDQRELYLLRRLVKTIETNLTVPRSVVSVLWRLCLGRERAMASMPGPSLGSGEELLFSGHAVHKKALGTVWFTSRKVLWRATDAKAAVQKVELRWASVRSFQVPAI